ncbi:hypothetical protein PHSY_003989 [Pseudozyma hubeiensis SY62]|uniref:Uncharacterized protein n=1 Tax=Pseudozyma hubeiensis (strain SY62) TaxID=1305764 RepID=R9P530_PSEHS|nr:hypothetical protein PHSY_003989 [Pseudozyma hubeiensis SY62]GAC96409.1 hypothetical protein PHSY_003989 [Pseudozyma hubeiensis SY62]
MSFAFSRTKRCPECYVCSASGAFLKTSKVPRNCSHALALVRRSHIGCFFRPHRIQAAVPSDAPKHSFT